MKAIDLNSYSSLQEMMSQIAQTIGKLSELQLGDSMKIIVANKEFVLKKTSETVNNLVEVKR